MAAMFKAELDELNGLKELLAIKKETTFKMAANSRLPKEAPQIRPLIRPHVKLLKTGKTQVKLLPLKYTSVKFASLKSPKTQIVEAVDKLNQFYKLLENSVSHLENLAIIKQI